MTHSNKLEGLPSRPDKHIVFTIMLPLLHVRVSLRRDAVELTLPLADHRALCRN